MMRTTKWVVSISSVRRCWLEFLHRPFVADLSPLSRVRRLAHQQSRLHLSHQNSDAVAIARTDHCVLDRVLALHSAIRVHADGNEDLPQPPFVAAMPPSSSPCNFSRA
ncbi:hypothetical protein RJT11_03090 [Segatella copri]|uniref:hypothetical protein n=1 Tax=Segatella copri TaxID=165179 RepID=UPI00294B5AB6|nr:hypothetical protein [Segatella copri]WOG04526.1 hypothetical protein RJT11_03090 [Segatella copri]